jgi:hypothetical protein
MVLGSKALEAQASRVDRIVFLPASQSPRGAKKIVGHRKPGSGWDLDQTANALW